MKIVLKFSDGVDLIQNVPDWVRTERKVTAVRPGFNVVGDAGEYVDCEFRGQMCHEVPVFEEITKGVS